MFKWAKIRRIKRRIAELQSACNAIYDLHKISHKLPSDEMILQYADLAMEIGGLKFDLEQLQRE